MFALATLPYLAATLLARVCGDGLTARHAATTVVRAGSVLAFVGLVVIVFAEVDLTGRHTRFPSWWASG
jgi:hypothetical protein